MPRKLRPGKARRTTSLQVSAALRHFLTWRDLDAAAAIAERDGTSPWDVLDNEDELEAPWHAIAAEALTDWVAVYPGTRPQSWWQWTAPELRRIEGRFVMLAPGRDDRRCQPTGIPYGEPDDWTDLPLVESTPAYLDRLGLWLPREQARVPEVAFRPQVFTWTLTEAMGGRPVQEHGDPAA